MIVLSIGNDEVQLGYQFSQVVRLIKENIMYNT